jgi:CRP-like cAMP-binding protein
LFFVSRFPFALLVIDPSKFIKVYHIPPKEDVIVQNEAPDDVYVVVSGEVEVILFDGIDERVEATLGTRDIFGEVSALSDRAQAFTFRTRTLSQLLRLKQATLKEAMQSRPEDSVVIIKNFLEVTTYQYQSSRSSLQKCEQTAPRSVLVVITETVALLVSVCVAASGRGLAG